MFKRALFGKGDGHTEVLASGPRFRGKQVAPTKQLVTIRLDRDVVAAYRNTGPGWQTRINAALRRGAKRLSRS